VLFGVRIGLLGQRRKRDELDWDHVHVSTSEVAPEPEEAQLTPQAVLAKLAEFKAPLGCNCLTLVVPAGSWNIQNLESMVSGRRARKYLQLVTASYAGSEVPANGLGIFMKVYGKDDMMNELVAIEPPEPLRKFALSDGPLFATEFLSQLFATGVAARGIACAVISGEEALLYRLFADHGRREARIQPRLQKRQKKGGQSALRIARLAEEVRAAYVRIVAERVNSEFTGDEGVNAVLTVIGGSRELADNLYASEHLDYRIKKSMKRAPEIKENDNMSDICKKASAHFKAEENVASMAALRACEARAHTELAAYGMKDVMRRIEEYNIATLLYAAGSGLPSTLAKQAKGIGGAKVLCIEQSAPAHEELVRKWGGAFALLQWKPQDFDDAE